MLSEKKTQKLHYIVERDLQKLSVGWFYQVGISASYSLSVLTFSFSRGT